MRTCWRTFYSDYVIQLWSCEQSYIPHWSSITHFFCTSSNTVPTGHWQPTTHWVMHTTGPGSLHVGGHAVPQVVNTCPSMGHDSKVRERWYHPHTNTNHSLGRHFTTGGQGALTHCTSCSEHVSFDAHPPLSRSHDGWQNASPVGWNTSHLEPVGHSKLSQGLTNSNSQCNILCQAVTMVTRTSNQCASNQSSICTYAVMTSLSDHMICTYMPCIMTS